MSSFIELTASDGHRLAAWFCEPTTPPKGGVVVVQEIFGVNDHIRDVTARFAALGYLAIAPAMFDRFARGFDCGYSPEEFNRALALMPQIDIDKALLDVDAALTKIRPAGKVGVVGFCFGGLMAWLSACRLRPDAAIGYYGGRISQFNAETPTCPTQLHFGRKDAHIPLSDVEAIKAAHPDLPVYLYDADHGFACDQRGSFDQAANDLAWQRSREFLAHTLG